MSAAEPRASGIADPAGISREIYEIPLDGCSPIPLASYLKALGVLRLVSEQVDADAQGYWRGDGFVLVSCLDGAGVCRFFQREYRPTPLIAPWGARSGFYDGSAEKTAREALAAIERSSDERLALFRDAVASVRSLLNRHGFTDKPKDDEHKLALMRACRAELPDPIVRWLDACYVLTADWRRFPPLLGTGGNEGSGSYVSGFAQQIVTCLIAGKRVHALSAALFGRMAPNAASDQTPGQFTPSAAGGPNQGTGFAGAIHTNPWDYLLCLEGTLLFASAATRRLGDSTSATASFPFSAEVTGAGSGATATADESDARAEMWVPLWHSPTRYSELQVLFSEGRVQLGRTRARSGLDFARAVAHLGIDRGIDAFQRFLFVQRFGKSVFAVPANRIEVRRNAAADLIDELDDGGWLYRLRGFARSDGANRVLSLVRRLEDAVFELVLDRARSAPRVQRLLEILGEVQLYLARSPKAREPEACLPVPWLSKRWVEEALDGSDEFAIAVALAGLHARALRVDGDGSEGIMPMRAHLAPESYGRRPIWDEHASHSVTWGMGSLEANLAVTLQRRVLEAQIRELNDKPLTPSRMAPMGAVGSWLADQLDSRRIASLVPGLMLVRVPAGTDRGAAREAPLPVIYRVLKPFFSVDAQLIRAGLLRQDGRLGLPAEMIRRLVAGDTAGCLAGAVRRLRVAGIPIDFRNLEAGTIPGRRLLAALMVPIADDDLQQLLPRPKREEQR